MDRFTWGIVAGAVLLVALGLVSVTVLRRPVAAPDLSTPDGVVRAYVEDATNVRVRDISLSYQAPDSWLQSLGARSLRFTFQARNPFVFTHYWSFDPEFNNFGITNLNRFIDLAPFPGNRQFYVSVDVGW